MTSRNEFYARLPRGRPILRADGVYLSQFVTGTSNKGLTA